MSFYDRCLWFHYNHNFSQLCYFQMYCVLFPLLQYFSYSSQFLSFGVFQLFNHYYTNDIEKDIQIDDENFDKVEFSTAFQLFCNPTLKPSTIRYFLKSTGLVSFNPNVVIRKNLRKTGLKAALNSVFSHHLMKSMNSE